jgi:hypothetical protein
MELLLKRLAWSDRLSEAQQAQIVEAISSVQTFGPREIIVPAEVPVNFSSVILEGLSTREKILKSGARQITAFHLAGDFCDLHTYVLKTLPDSVVAMSACKVAIVPHSELDKIFRESYHIARLCWASTLIDASDHFNWATIRNGTVGPFVLRALSSIQNGRARQGHELPVACDANGFKRRAGPIFGAHKSDLRQVTLGRPCNFFSAHHHNS